MDLDILEFVGDPMVDINLAHLDSHFQIMVDMGLDLTGKHLNFVEDKLLELGILVSYSVQLEDKGLDFVED